jgi:hypothetical protein
MRFPAEWEQLERTWVAFPHAGYTLGEECQVAIKVGIKRILEKPINLIMMTDVIKQFCLK